MIQRIQTLWLALAVIISAVLLNIGCVNLEGGNSEKYLVGFKGITVLKDTGTEVVRSSVVIPVTLILVPLLSLTAIFLFKRRTLQKNLTLLAVALSICLCIIIVYYCALLINRSGAAFVPGFRMILPVLMLIATIMAYRGIVKDEKLVKSYDRLR